MALGTPFHFTKWINDNRDKLKPPVNNMQVYKDNKDFIVMVVGGPNARKDFHYNEGEEFFYQLEGDITLRVMDEGQPKDIHIKEGEIFLLPPKVPHSPQRPANTVGLVIERHRRDGEQDGLMWFCDGCHEKLHEDYFALNDIVAQLKAAIEGFYSNEELRTCKKCNHVMPVPGK